MLSFAAIKNTVLGDLAFAQVGQTVDPFMLQQYQEFVNRISKCKGWAELVWRLKNIPPDLVQFKNHSVEEWVAAIEVKSVPNKLIKVAKPKLPMEYAKIYGSYRLKKMSNGNVILQSSGGRMTLKPMFLRPFIVWLKENVPEVF